MQFTELFLYSSSGHSNNILIMKTKIILLSALISFTYLFSQVGINTTSPQASFHVDGAKDNPATGIPTATQQLNDFVVTSSGNVGIGNVNPQKALDIEARNGSLRITNLLRQTPGNYDILSRSIDNGDVYATSYSYTVTVTIASGAQSTITIPSTVDIPSGYMIIRSANGCGRTMVSTFVYYSITLGYVSGVARDRIGAATINPIPVGSNTSGTWNVNFANVIQCADGGDDTQFNFTVIKPTANTYTITNRGNVSRVYQLTIVRL
jgi:hypothetical protein